MITFSVLNKAERAISEMPALDVQPVNDWISVKDRLPKSTRYDCYCFLVTDGDLIHMAYFVENEWMFADSGQAKNKMFYEVTHWMPLPEPPESEDDTE